VTLVSGALGHKWCDQRFEQDATLLVHDTICLSIYLNHTRSNMHRAAVICRRHDAAILPHNILSSFAQMLHAKSSFKRRPNCIPESTLTQTPSILLRPHFPIDHPPCRKSTGPAFLLQLSGSCVPVMTRRCVVVGRMRNRLWRRDQGFLL
jgi:hypothetical protein